MITFERLSGQRRSYLPTRVRLHSLVCERHRTTSKYRQLYQSKSSRADGAMRYTIRRDADGRFEREADATREAKLETRCRRLHDLFASTISRVQRPREHDMCVRVSRADDFVPAKAHWKTNADGIATAASRPIDLHAGQHASVSCGFSTTFPSYPLTTSGTTQSCGFMPTTRSMSFRRIAKVIRTLHPDGHRPRRPRARPDLRFRHHRLLSPSNGAAAGSRLTPRAWRWRWPVPASWARAIRTTCWPIPAKASSRKPKSPAPRRVRSPCTGTSATASSMSACRTSRSSPSPTTPRSMSSGTSGRRSWSRCARS